MSGGIVVNIVIEPLLVNLLRIFLCVMKKEAEPLGDGVGRRRYYACWRLRL
ncbi:hypothetical protein KCQ_01485 [Pectobacterium atrosepticum ICMP 1526]|nr:hypothetical protein KCQ_01485 [Pectobacterium atrosepticum ICMP 1526]